MRKSFWRAHAWARLQLLFPFLTVFLFRNAFENCEKIIKDGGCHPHRYVRDFVKYMLISFSCQWSDSALRTGIRRTEGTSWGSDESRKHLQRHSDHRRWRRNPKWKRQISGVSLQSLAEDRQVLLGGQRPSDKSSWCRRRCSGNRLDLLECEQKV